MLSRYKKIAMVAVCASLFAPFAASADTTSDLQQKINDLLAQVKVLQQQLRALQASSTPAWSYGSTTWQGGATSTMRMPGCVNLMRGLKIGIRGDDVKEVQKMLADQDPNDEFGQDKITGFFGPMTATAMARFQERFGIASSTDGTIGPRTMQFFKERCWRGEGPRPGMGGTMMPWLNASGTFALPPGLQDRLDHMMKDQNWTFDASGTLPVITPEMKKKADEWVKEHPMPQLPGMMASGTPPFPGGMDINDMLDTFKGMMPKPPQAPERPGQY